MLRLTWILPFFLLLPFAFAGGPAAAGDDDERKAREFIDRLFKAGGDDLETLTEELRPFGEPAVGVLVEYLKSDDPKIYRKAYQALGAFREEAVYPLGAAYEAGPARVRFHAVEILGNSGDCLALDLLLGPALADASPHPTPPREPGPVRRLCDAAWLAAHKLISREGAPTRESFAAAEPAERDRAIAACKTWWAEARPRTLLPRYIEALGSAHLGVRRGAWSRLAELVKDGPAYDPAAPAEARKAAAAAWMDWWRDNAARFEKAN